MGIIPARAGFTWDCACEFEIMAGSSPLARGLRIVCVRLRIGIGIIPARAGFTVFDTGVALLCWDHPRSRGVYRDVEKGFITGTGSSPLARGLLQFVNVQSRSNRIIPARAGFTGWPESRRWKCWDHPRSRGVYGENLP